MAGWGLVGNRNRSLIGLSLVSQETPPGPDNEGRGVKTWLARSQNGCLSHKKELIKLTISSGAESRAQAGPRDQMALPEQGAGPDDFQRCLPISSPLWFCAVKLWLVALLSVLFLMLLLLFLALFPGAFDCCTKISDEIPKGILRRVERFEIQKADGLCHLEAVM